MKMDRASEYVRTYVPVVGGNVLWSTREDMDGDRCVRSVELTKLGLGHDGHGIRTVTLRTYNKDIVSWNISI